MFDLPHDTGPYWIHQKKFWPSWPSQLDELDLPSQPTSGSEVRLAGQI